jgi:heat shock protein HtpX
MTSPFLLSIVFFAKIFLPGADEISTGRYKTIPDSYFKNMGDIVYIFIILVIFCCVWVVYIMYKFKRFNKIYPDIPINRDDLPALYNILDELKLATGLKMPINIYMKYSSYAYSYILRDNYYNITITLSSQLLMSLNRNEVQAVISYELAHLIDNNIKIMEYFTKHIYFPSGEDSGGMIYFSMLIFFNSPLKLIIKPFIKDLVYIDDATAIHITKNPDSLKSALKNISEINREALDIAIPDYIANISITNPNESRKNDLVHPPTSRRIAIINKIKGSSYSLDVYNQAYKNVTGKSLKKALTKLPVIAYSPAIYNDDTKLLTEQSEFYKTIIRSTKGYIPYTCTCGLKMSIPAEYYKQYYQCPKCKTNVIFPDITLKDIEYEKIKSPDIFIKRYKIQRRKNRLTISCICGKNIIISPDYFRYSGDVITCKHCGRTIKVEKVKDK